MDRLTQVCPCSGHALLVGVGGSGKQSLARLAGHICGYATTTIVISGNYNMANFREDLQKMYKRAGVKVSDLRFDFSHWISWVPAVLKFCPTKCDGLLSYV